MANLGLGFSPLLLTFLLFLLVVVQPSQSQSCSSHTFSKNRFFASCNALPYLASSLHWTYDPTASTLFLAFVAPPSKSNGWISWAINPTDTGMIGAQSLIAFHQPDGSMGVKTFNVTSYGPIRPSKIAFEVSDLEAEYSGGVMRIFATVKLPRGMKKVNQVWQVGASVTGLAPDKHAFAAENLKAKGTLDLIRGQSGGSGGDSTLRKKNIHGVLNAVSWGILLPIGAIISRYLKTFNSAEPAWFYLHVSCQLIGYIVGVAGWGTGLNLGSKSKGIQYTTHRDIGIALFCIATLQIFALLLRPKKDHKYRIFWNGYHHVTGYSVIVLGVINVFKGLDILNPDKKWKTAYIFVICILAGIALLLEVITWIIVLKRKSDKSTKLYDGTNSANGHHGKEPFRI